MVLVSGVGRLMLAVTGRLGSGSGLELAELFFVAADAGGDGFECGAQCGDVGGEAGEGVALGGRWRWSSTSARRAGLR